MSGSFPNRANWPAGPWDDEPNRVLWIDDATGVQCLARRGPAGQWCGYVGVEKGHPWFDQDDYGKLEVDVHGGLTYADHCDDDPINGVCHVAEAGHDDLFWVGFDCGHFMDVIPGMKGFTQLGTYKTVDYVIAEVERLAKQAAAA